MRRAMHQCAATCCLLIAVQGHAFANSGKPATPTANKSRATSVVLTGEVIDPQCFFMHDSRGLDHVACATRCAKGGQGLAFLEEGSGTVYTLIARTHGVSQNELVLPHVGRRVQVKGVLYARGAQSVLQVQSVAKATAPVKN